MRKIPFALLGLGLFRGILGGMNSPEEAIKPVNGSSGKQAGNLRKLLDVIACELKQIENQAPSNLQAVTFVVKLDRRGRPRTVLIRTESKSELSA